MRVRARNTQTLVESAMAKNFIKAGVKTPIAEVAGPTSNVERLRTHLEVDSLALKLLDTWKGAKLGNDKAKLLKTVDDYFSETK
jgi:hypothetical protein